MTIRTRKLVGMLALLAFLAAYCLAVMVAGAAILTDRPVWLQTICYLAAGFAWIIPARALIGWMQRPD